jgi:hypothetical protein
MDLPTIREGYVPCTAAQNGRFAHCEYRRSASGPVFVTADVGSGHGGLGSRFDIDLVQR